MAIKKKKLEKKSPKKLAKIAKTDLKKVMKAAGSDSKQKKVLKNLRKMKKK